MAEELENTVDETVEDAVVDAEPATEEETFETIEIFSWTEGNTAKKGKVVADWELVKNKPDVAALQTRVAALEAENATLTAAVQALQPKIVSFAATTGVANLISYKYEGDEEPVKADFPAALTARDGDFGYPDNSGSGQVNFGVAFNEGYDILDDATDNTDKMFNNFKTPYSTGIAGLYRYTKVAKNFNAVLVAKKEADLESWSVTVKKEYASSEAGTIGDVIAYRTSDKFELGKETLVFNDSNEATTVSYSKETGFRAKAEVDKDGKLAAQVNLDVAVEVNDGYELEITATAGTYKNLKITDITGGKSIQLTQVKGDVTITIALKEKPAVQYNVTYSVSGEGDNDYKWSTAEAEIPAVVGENENLVAAFYHQTNCDNPTKNTACLPDGASKTLPTAEACLDRIESIKINNVELAKSEVAVAVSGKKATITIPAAKINGNIVIKLGSYVEPGPGPEPEPEAVETEGTVDEVNQTATLTDADLSEPAADGTYNLVL